MIFEKLKLQYQKSRFIKACASLNNHGQALVEYILILVVTVSIILGLLSRFNRSFGDWVNNYFGEYVACLLETGELPSLQGQGGANATLCNQLYEPFTMQAGRPPKKSSQNSQSSSGSKRGDRFRGSSSNSSSGSGADSGAGSSAVRRGSPFVAGGSGGSGGLSNSSSIAGVKEENGEDDDEFSNVSQINGIVDGSGDERIRRSQIRTSSSVEEEKKNNDGKSKVVAKIKAEDGEENSKRFLATGKIVKKTQVDPDTSLEFGDYLRYLIIALVILIFVIMLMGQGYQVKKSLE
jgi:hypothetical protein